MPFVNDVKNTVATNVAVSAHVKESAAKEGINGYNLNNYQPAPITVEEQFRRDTNVTLARNTIEQNIQQTLHAARVTPEQFGLTRPMLEHIPKPMNEMTNIDKKICELVIAKIWNAIVRGEYYYFYAQPWHGEFANYTPQQKLQHVVNSATRHDYQIIMELFNIPSLDIATDLAVCSLFDYIILGDNSTSMNMSGNQNMMKQPERTCDYDQFETQENNNVTRWELMKQLIKNGAFIMTMFDEDGISLRWLNNNDRYAKDNIKTVMEVEAAFGMDPHGNTEIGRALTEIATSMIYPKLQNNQLMKPVMIVTYTDGVSNDDIKMAIRDIRRNVKNSKYGSRAALFIFNQVGNDKSAEDALSIVDNEKDSRIGANDGSGDITDCTSNFKKEKAQYDAAQLRVNPELRCPYTAYTHMLKGLIGPAMEKYDGMDEIMM